MDLAVLFKELGINVIPNAKLSDYTTFRLGGSCSALVECCNAKEMTAAVTALRALNKHFVIMGFGSNILPSDEGIKSIVIRYSSQIPTIIRDGTTLTVDAGTQFDHLVDFAVREGFNGLTAMSGIPGTVGGAIAGNAGAYGQQVTDRLIRLTILKTDNSVVDLPKSSVKFSYRDSALKHNNDIVLNAVFELEPSNEPDLLIKEREEKIAVRMGKHGDWRKNPCAGSFFKNVLPSSNAGQRQAAGWFLDQSGAKELSVGKAHPYKDHANIVTRDDGATAQDVYDLTIQMAKRVKEKFGIELVREVRLLGKFNNAPESNPEGYW